MTHHEVWIYGRDEKTGFDAPILLGSATWVTFAGACCMVLKRHFLTGHLLFNEDGSLTLSPFGNPIIECGDPMAPNYFECFASREEAIQANTEPA